MNPDRIPNPFLESCPHLDGDLVHLNLMVGRGDVWAEESAQYLTRLTWLHAQAHCAQEQQEQAVQHLQLLLTDMERLSDPGTEFVVDRARVDTDTTIVSNSEVKRQLNFMQRSQMLEQVVSNYTDGRYQVVAELLMAIFNEPPPKSRPGVTLPSRQTQLAILIDSLYKLYDYKGVMTWGAKSLSEALMRYNRAEAEEEKNRWAKTVMKISDTLNTTLHHTITAIEEVERELVVQLVATLIEMQVIQLEKSQNAPVLPFETLSPWILLHRMLAHEEQLPTYQRRVDTTTDRKLPHLSDSEEGSRKDGAGQPPADGCVKAGDNTEACKSDSDKTMQDEDSSSENKNRVVPYPSTLFLITAHDELGKHSWCCYDEGTLLLYSLEVLLRELRRDLDTQHHQLLHHTLEQVSFCLYSHPSKKSKHKHLRDHGVQQIALTWDRALQLYKYYCPAHLPDFQSSQIPSITDDTAALYKRIIALFPAEVQPEKKVEEVEGYLSGQVEAVTYTALQLPTNTVRDCFYLLGDYYFKNKEWSTAIKYYKLDVAVNMERLEAWAPLGLAMKAILETQLNSCEVIQDEEVFFSMAQAAAQCFRQALRLDEYHTNLWVEFGGLVYMVHSHASRLLKQDLNPDISLEAFERLEKLKVDMLEEADRCFTQALKIQEEGWDDDVLPDERWLHSYMLGKVSEKKGHPVETVLQYYLKAGIHLHTIQAKYPKFINYNSPQEYAVESLEMYYRAHAYILKYLQQKEGKYIEPSVLSTFNCYLDVFSAGPFVSRKEYKKSSSDTKQPAEGSGDGNKQDTAEEASKNCPQKRSREEGDNEDPPSKRQETETGQEDGVVSEVVDQLITDASAEVGKGGTGGAEEPQATTSSPSKDRRESDDEILVVEEKVVEKGDQAGVVRRCIGALKLCLTRFPQHYKSQYRLANYYNCSKFCKDPGRARNYLLGCENWQRVGYMPVNGLFHERKVWIQQPRNSNFFHGVWRIPNDEVDRPGSFAAHMYRCVSLTLDILPQLKDFYAVLLIALALKNSPEKDKKYLRDNERELLSEHATQVGLQTMRDKNKLLFRGSSPIPAARRMTFLLDVFRCYKHISKHLPGSEPHLAKMLTETYAAFREVKMDGRTNLLREADAFCTRNQHLQHRIQQASSPAIQVNTGPSLSRAITASTVARGRGRPPLSGRGRGRGRGSAYAARQPPGMMAIQEAYKLYENVVKIQALLNNSSLDRAATYTHQKELEYYQTELLKYLRIPSVSQYFKASLQSLGSTAAKLPPPIKDSNTTAPPSARGGPQEPSKVPPTPASSQAGSSSSSMPGPSLVSTARPALSALAARSQAHGISITSVSSSRAAPVSKPLKPNMSVTVSPIKPSAASPTKDNSEISVISVTRPPATTSKTSAATVTPVTVTSKTNPPATRPPPTTSTTTRPPTPTTTARAPTPTTTTTTTARPPSCGTTTARAPTPTTTITRSPTPTSTTARPPTPTTARAPTPTSTTTRPPTPTTTTRTSTPTTTTVRPPPTTTTPARTLTPTTIIVRPSPTTTITARPLPSTTTAVRPPPITTNVSRPPPTTSTAVRTPPSTIMTVRPPPTTTMTVRPPPTSTITVRPPQTTTTTTRPPPSTTITARPPPSTTITARPPPTTSITVRPPSSTSTAARAPSTTTPQLSFSKASQPSVTVSSPTKDKLSSSVPKLPAGTTLTRPQSAASKGPRPQLQAQARLVKDSESDSATQGHQPSSKTSVAEIISTTAAPATPSSGNSNTAVAAPGKPTLSKDTTITPAPRIKSKTTPSPTSKPAASPSNSSSFLGAFAASLGLPGNKSSGTRAGASHVSQQPAPASSISASVIGPARQGASAQASKQVAQLSPAQLIELAYSRTGKTGSKGQQPADRDRPLGPQKPGITIQRYQGNRAPRPQPPGPQRAPQVRPVQQPRFPAQPRPVQVRPSLPTPAQPKPSSGKSSSDDVITLD